MPDRPLARYVTLQSKTQTVAGMHSKETRTRDPGSRMPEDPLLEGGFQFRHNIWHYSCIISLLIEIQLNTLLLFYYIQPIAAHIEPS